MGYMELWVNDGYPRACDNPDGAFDNDEMRHMFDMPNGILIEGYDTTEEMDVMFKILTGEIKPSETGWFDNGGQNFIARLFIKYVNAVRDTKCYWVVSGTEGRINTIGPYSFETESEADDYMDTLSSHFRNQNIASRWVVSKQKQGGMRL